MNQVFDLLQEIREAAALFAERAGQKATVVSLSPGSYRRLLEIQASEHAIGNLIICCAPIHEIALYDGKLSVLIDEMLTDTTVVLA